ncbi:hypothetical protein OH491_24905 [Termitidicoccus mucosus]|uniref:Uncharacterized protein n=1 Tax=Termitidicoccus mucosus TaxID=1184151 RepID=A0A178IPW5_9BACT|nr:hypothetical protein AW736_01630 [Opitutaceae bacterium TSB47]
MKLPACRSNAKTLRRHQQLLPAGIPKYIRCYDNGGKTFDRYTVIYTGRYPKTGGEFFYRGMSKHPFHPQGFGQSGSLPSPGDTNRWGYAPQIGRKNHLGTRIPFSDLPPDCQMAVRMDYLSLWSLEHTPIAKNPPAPVRDTSRQT